DFTHWPPMKLSSVRTSRRSATSGMEAPSGKHNYMKLGRAQQERLRFTRPAFLPCRAGGLARSRAQAVQRLLFGWKGFEQIEQHVGELPAIREQQAVVAVADALGEARAVVERAHG